VKEPSPQHKTPARLPKHGIGALYRKMSSWYIVFSIVLFGVILGVGFLLARPLLPALRP
jgi:hypothetical protein